MPSAEYRSSVKRFAPENERDLNNGSATIGDATRDSTHRKTSRRNIPPDRLPVTSGFRQPSFEDSRSPVTIPPRLAVASNAPCQSSRFTSELRLSGTWRNEIATTAAASGTFIKKAQRHDAYSISAPPRTGPSAVVI